MFQKKKLPEYLYRKGNLLPKIVRGAGYCEMFFFACVFHNFWGFKKLKISINEGQMWYLKLKVHFFLRASHKNALVRLCECENEPAIPFGSIYKLLLINSDPLLHCHLDLSWSLQYSELIWMAVSPHGIEKGIIGIWIKFLLWNGQFYSIGSWIIIVNLVFVSWFLSKICLVQVFDPFTIGSPVKNKHHLHSRHL